MRMTECFVRGCAESAATIIDLAPEKSGGWSSYSYEVAVCAVHATAINGGEPWVCRDEDDVPGSGGWEVLMGEDIKLLNEWKLTGNSSVGSGSKAARASEGLIAGAWRITLPLQQIGKAKPVAVNLRLTREQAKELREDLRLIAGE